MCTQIGQKLCILRYLVRLFSARRMLRWVGDDRKHFAIYRKWLANVTPPPLRERRPLNNHDLRALLFKRISPEHHVDAGVFARCRQVFTAEVVPIFLSASYDDLSTSTEKRDCEGVRSLNLTSQLYAQALTRICQNIFH